MVQIYFIKTYTALFYITKNENLYIDRTILFASVPQSPSHGSWIQLYGWFTGHLYYLQMRDCQGLLLWYPFLFQRGPMSLRHSSLPSFYTISLGIHLPPLLLHQLHCKFRKINREWNLHYLSYTKTLISLMEHIMILVHLPKWSASSKANDPARATITSLIGLNIVTYNGPFVLMHQATRGMTIPETTTPYKWRTR